MVCGTLAEWVTAGATILLFIAATIAACLAYRNLKTYRKQLDIYREEVNRNTFQALLKEISDEQASLHRGLVTEYITQEYTLEDIERLVMRVRRGEQNQAADIGRAAERTIARMDRVGFFLVDDKTNKLKMEPPLWLRTIVAQMWGRLGE